MKQRNRTNYLFALGVLGLTFGFYSCVDNRYDLDDIDMTLGVNTDLQLPTSSVGDILLKNIMDLKEDGVVQTVPNPLDPGNMMYVVRQSGTADIDPVKIARIEIDAPTVETFTSTVEMSKIFGAKVKSAKAPAKFGDITLPEDETYRYAIGEDQGKQTIEPSTAKNISADVLSITAVKFEETTITLSLNIIGFPSHIDKMHMDGLELRLPEDLNVTSCTLNGVEAVSIDAGVIKLTEDIDVDARSISEPVTLTLTIGGATTGTDFNFDSDKHEATLSGEFKINGAFRIETAEMDKAAITQMVIDYIIKHPGTTPSWDEVEGMIPTSITLTGNTWFDRGIHLTHVSGKFQHEVGTIDPLKLNDLPKFLDDDDVVLDLANPMIFLNIENGLPATITTGLTFKSDTDRDEDGNIIPRSTGVLEIIGNASNKYYLADHEEDKYLPEGNKDAMFERVEGLPMLIWKIPKEVNVEVATVKLSANDLDITKEYPIAVSYDVYAPLVFGKEFQLVYSGVENDWDLSEDIGNLQPEFIEVKATVSSSLPAAMNLTLDFIDEHGNKITTVKDNTISCPANNTNAIELKIKAKEGHTLNEILSGKDKNGKPCPKLDGIRYRATLHNPIEGKALNDQATIKISDVKVSLKGILIYDAN